MTLHTINQPLVPLIAPTATTPTAAASDNATYITPENTSEKMVNDVSSQLETQCLFGELFDVTHSDGDLSTGTLMTDGYHGVLPTAALSGVADQTGLTAARTMFQTTTRYEPCNPLDTSVDSHSATHRVVVPQTIVTASPSVTSRAITSLFFGSCVTVLEHDSGCARVTINGEYGFLPDQAIAARQDTVDDWVCVAEQFMGRPYLWGGRSAAGIDCSALVQLALSRAGVQLPRNSSDQYRALVAADHRDPAELAARFGSAGARPGGQRQGGQRQGGLRQGGLQRGDLVFWAGHIGIMQDPGQLLHANAHHRCVATEPVQEARRRIKEHGGGDITGWSRPLPSG